jgi:hypothetical protein
MPTNFKQITKMVCNLKNHTDEVEMSSTRLFIFLKKEKMKTLNFKLNRFNIYYQQEIFKKNIKIFHQYYILNNHHIFMKDFQ